MPPFVQNAHKLIATTAPKLSSESSSTNKRAALSKRQIRWSFGDGLTLWRGRPSKGNNQQMLAAQAWLNDQEIPFVIIGSTAVSAWVDQGASMDFHRDNAYSGWQRIPDLDLLVPQKSIEAVQEFAHDSMNYSEFPVKIDTAIAACFVDYQPDKQYSYLTHKKMRFPLESRLFSPRFVEMLGVDVQTIDPRVLLHTFKSCGGILRPTDIPKVFALNDVISVGNVSTVSREDCEPFHEFIRERDRRYPLFIAAKRTWHGIAPHLPRNAGGAALHHINPVYERLFRSKR